MYNIKYKCSRLLRDIETLMYNSGIDDINVLYVYVNRYVKDCIYLIERCLDKGEIDYLIKSREKLIKEEYDLSDIRIINRRDGVDYIINILLDVYVIVNYIKNYFNYIYF